MRQRHVTGKLYELTHPHWRHRAYAERISLLLHSLHSVYVAIFQLDTDRPSSHNVMLGWDITDPSALAALGRILSNNGTTSSPVSILDAAHILYVGLTNQTQPHTCASASTTASHVEKEKKGDKWERRKKKRDMRNENDTHSMLDSKFAVAGVETSR